LMHKLASSVLAPAAAAPPAYSSGLGPDGVADIDASGRVTPLPSVKLAVNLRGRVLAATAVTQGLLAPPCTVL